MGITLAQEYTAMLFMLLCGAICGVLYDAIRISRVLMRLASYTRAGKRLEKIRFPLIGAARERTAAPVSRVLKNVGLAVGDILFSIVCGCMFSIFLAHFASGVFRWFFILGSGIGFFLYYFTVGRAVMFASEMIAGILRTIFRYAVWFLVLPMRLLVRAGCAVGKLLQSKIIVPAQKTAMVRARIRYTHKIKNELPTAMQLSIERSD